MMTPDDISLYRPCAGIVLFNQHDLIFLGRRVVKLNDKEIDGRWWHMPQGGINEDEDAKAAALRELHEETNISSLELIGEIDNWLYYDLPSNLLKRAWGGRYRGQRQKWFVARFTGDDSEININFHGNNHEPEFVEWAWVPVASIVELAVPFKRDIYRQIISSLSCLSVV